MLFYHVICAHAYSQTVLDCMLCMYMHTHINPEARAIVATTLIASGTDFCVVFGPI